MLLNGLNTNALLFISFVLFCIGLFIFFKNQNYRHTRNIKKSHLILDKVRSFEGAGKEARILLYLRKINAYVFEELLLTAFEKKGYNIKRNKHYSGDGGIDGRVYIQNQLYLIQAKRYRNYINSQHLFGFSKLVTHEGGVGGMFFTTGKTHSNQREKYRDSNIKIISGDKLVKFLCE